MTEAKLSEVFAFIEANAEDAVKELQTLLRQPSISAQKVGLEPCTELLMQRERAGISDTDILPTGGGPPVVVGHLRNPRAERTLLCYGHYDVQPPEPLELWHSDPFGAEIRDGVLYARGATDNKSGCLAFVKAAQAYLETQGAPPVTLVFLFEGEEEVGSPHLEARARTRTKPPPARPSHRRRSAPPSVIGTTPLVQGVSVQGVIMLAIPHPAVLSDFGAPENNLHAPNENMPVGRYLQGIRYAAAIMHEYALATPLALEEKR